MTGLLIALAVLLLIGFIPAGAKVRYDDGDLEVKIKAGPFCVPLLPSKQQHGKKLARQYNKKVKADREKLKKKALKKVQKKKKKEEEKKKPKEQQARERLEKKKKKLSLDELMQLARIALKTVSKLPRKLVMKELCLHVKCGGGDAAQAAIGYGRVCAVTATALPILEKALRIRKRDVGVELDYGRENMGIFARLDVHMLVGTAVLLAFGAGFRFLKLLIESKIKHKMEKRKCKA